MRYRRLVKKINNADQLVEMAKVNDTAKIIYEIYNKEKTSLYEVSKKRGLSMDVEYDEDEEYFSLDIYNFEDGDRDLSLTLTTDGHKCILNNNDNEEFDVASLTRDEIEARIIDLIEEIDKPVTFNEYYIKTNPAFKVFLFVMIIVFLIPVIAAPILYHFETINGPTCIGIVLASLLIVILSFGCLPTITNSFELKDKKFIYKPVIGKKKIININDVKIVNVIVPKGYKITFEDENGKEILKCSLAISLCCSSAFKRSLNYYGIEIITWIN